jgi:hypothetical protein
MHYIFMLHGMGAPKKGWSKDAVKVLKDSYVKYPYLSSQISFEERFKPIELEYGSKFVEIVNAWSTNASAIGPLAEGVNNSQVTKLVGWLKGAGNVDDNFVWSHAADVLLYRLFADVREQIKVHVANQIIAKLNELKSSNDKWSVIGHSLGTAVAHDTLDMIWKGELPDGSDTGFEAKHNQASAVAMIANVSRVLQINEPVYESTVKPGPVGGNKSGCVNYLNVRHELDPFTFPKMFRPLEWPSKALADSGAYHYLEVDHYHKKNIHDLAHYFKNPAVHIALFRKLTNYSKFITEDQEKEALAAFSKFGIGKKTAIALRQRFEEMAPGIETLWPNIKNIWDAFEEVTA